MKISGYYKCISNITYNEVSFNKNDIIVINLWSENEIHYDLEVFLKGFGGYRDYLWNFMILKDVFHHHFKEDNNKIKKLKMEMHKHYICSTKCRLTISNRDGRTKTFKVGEEIVVCGYESDPSFNIIFLDILNNEYVYNAKILKFVITEQTFNDFFKENIKLNRIEKMEKIING